jgi:hypothetical protein
MSAQSEAVPTVSGGAPLPAEVPANPAPDATIEPEVSILPEPKIQSIQTNIKFKGR